MLPIHRLADEITTLAAHISAATCRWLLLIAEFDEREGWGAEGCRNCAAWVSWKCSMSQVAAREHVRVARRLTSLPLIREAFAQGELTYSKVRALTRVENIEREDELLMLARHATAAQLDRVVRGYGTVMALEYPTERAERSVTWTYDDDGSLVLRARLPADQGALVVAAIEAARDRLPIPSAEESEATEDPYRDRAFERNADALLALAETSLDEAAAGGSSADRYQVLVHVDAAAVAGDPHGHAELDNGVALPREIARRLTCDASIVRLVEQDGRPLTVGRKTRSIPPALRRALRARDGGCAFPGCTATRHVDAHHIEHWADGGRTNIDNLVHLCRHHHRLVHEGGFRIERRGAAVAFYTPQGRRLRAVPRARRGDCGVLTSENACRGVAVAAKTPTPLSYEPLDLGYGVDAMLQFAPPRRE